MAEHDIIYVNGELQEKKIKKIKCPPNIDWQKLVMEKQLEEKKK